MLSWILPDLPYRKKAAMVTMIAVFIVIQTRKQVGSWMDTGTLFSRADELIENNIPAKLMLTVQLGQKGKFQLAKVISVMVGSCL